MSRMIRDGIVHGMPDAEYHTGPELSSTGARYILDSPARFAWRNEHPEFSTALNFGKLAHLKVLGIGAEVVEIPDEHLTDGGRLSTKKATKEWRESLDPDATLMAPADLARASAIAEAVLAHEGARRLLERPGDNEVSLFATDPETGVRCRARYDRLGGDGLAVDFKTTSGTVSARGFGASAARYNYPVQEVFYADVYRWVTGETAPSMQFIVVETAPPYFVAVRTIPEDARLIAADKAAEARHIYAESARTDTWPSYGDGEAELPVWWLYQNDDDMEVELVL